MAAPIDLRNDFDSVSLRRLAKRTRDATQSRRLLALAEVYDGGSRTDASRIDPRHRTRGRGPPTCRAPHVSGPDSVVPIQPPCAAHASQGLVSDSGHDADADMDPVPVAGRGLPLLAIGLDLGVDAGFGLTGLDPILDRGFRPGHRAPADPHWTGKFAA